MNHLAVTPPRGYGAADGRLTLDGHDLVALARAHGTPLFVFSEARLRGNARRFRQAAEAGHPRVLVCYASKACSNLSVLAAVREEGLGAEVNSGGELHKALAAGVAPDRIVFNGVAKTVEEIGEAIGRGIKAINVDSPFELRRTPA
ncbi:diaminopimelate decarboxylase family protein, partial [Inquilinus limosus]